MFKKGKDFISVFSKSTRETYDRLGIEIKKVRKSPVLGSGGGAIKTLLETGEYALIKEGKEIFRGTQKEVDEIAKTLKGMSDDAAEKYLDEINQLNIISNKLKLVCKYDFRKGISFYFEGIEIGSSNVSKNGFIAFDLNIPKNLQRKGLGTQIINESITFFKNKIDIKGIQARWLNHSNYENGISVNLSEFKLNFIDKNLSLEKAAFETPTGKIADKLGFKKVSFDDWDILDLGNDKPADIYWVELKFKL